MQGFQVFFSLLLALLLFLHFLPLRVVSRQLSPENLKMWHKYDSAAKIWVFYCSTCTVDSSLPLTAKRSRRHHGTNGSKVRSSGWDCYWSMSCYNFEIIQSAPVSLFDIFQANWTLLLFIRGASYFLTGQRSDERPGYRILRQCQLFLKAAGQAYTRRALRQGRGL